MLQANHISKTVHEMLKAGTDIQIFYKMSTKFHVWHEMSKAN